MFWIGLMYSLIHISQGQMMMKLVNGNDTFPGEFPYMVSLRRGLTHSCGATIVNANYVLTAAHCVCRKSGPKGYLNIQYGKLKLTKTSDNSILVTRVVCHENYDDVQFSNDVAVLKLASPVPKKYLFTTKLAPSNFATDKDQNGIIVGWGRINTGGKRSESLQKVNVVVYNNDVCKSRVTDLRSYMCAGVYENGKGSCQGDSGGPLLIDDIQVGVISFGLSADCSVSNSSHPKVLARVSSYRNWIIRKTSPK